MRKVWVAIAFADRTLSFLELQLETHVSVEIELQTKYKRGIVRIFQKFKTKRREAYTHNMNASLVDLQYFLAEHGNKYSKVESTFS
jgi:hypothetical protein